VFSTPSFDSPHEKRIPPEPTDPIDALRGWLRMRYEYSPLRQGMTAAVAVLALSATPLFAQSIDTPPADASAPVLVTPPPVTSGATAAPPPAPAGTTAPATISAPTSTNNALDKVATEIKADSPDKAQPAQTAKPARATATKVAVAPRAPAPAVVREQPAAVQKVVPPAPAPIATPAAQPIPAATPQPTLQKPSSDETLPIAGLAGACFLALAGGAFAMTRRKRHQDDVDSLDEAATASVASPAVGASPMPAYAAVDSLAPSSSAPAAKLPTGFDISRFGRHAQAAYRGPTPDNPSLSLKKRLKVASFFDQRERMAAAVQPDRPANAQAARTEAPAVDRRTDHVVTQVKWPSRPGFRTSFQS
jgi:hypothetical protein